MPDSCKDVTFNTFRVIENEHFKYDPKTGPLTSVLPDEELLLFLHAFFNERMLKKGANIPSIFETNTTFVNKGLLPEDSANAS